MQKQNSFQTKYKGIKLQIFPSENQITAVAILEGGIRVVGKARPSGDDVFDPKFGLKLAKKNVYKKVLQKGRKQFMSMQKKFTTMIRNEDKEIKMLVKNKFGKK